MSGRDPIVAAVLGDPVVKAVLSDPAAATAVADAVTAVAGAVDPAAPVAPIAEHRATGPEPTPPAAAVVPGQTGTAIVKPDVMIMPSGKAAAVPTTTEEQDRATVGQRRVNLIWESQQAAIATAVVGTVLYVSARISLTILRTDATDQQTAMAVTGFMLLSNIINLVIGFYFGRTNHTKIGGVGQER